MGVRKFRDERMPADQDRLGALYARHAGPASRVAYLMTADRHLAEDITQEAFIRICARFGHLRNPEAFAGYLRRTVINLAREHARRAKLARERTRFLVAPNSVGEMPPTPRDDLRRALIELPARQRAAVVMRYYADLSEEQTADALGCSRHAVRSLVARAMETLRAEIKDE